VSNIQKRGGYTPRRAREARAYRLAVTGGTAGVVGAGIPIIALIVAAICLAMFRATTR
jgi:hypothetical protein